MRLVAGPARLATTFTTLKLAAPIPFLQTIQATKLKFVPVPGMPSSVPSTSVKLAGADGLRVEVLTSGANLDQVASLPELDWYAQTIPFFDYLLGDSRPAALLAGGHCVTLNLPAPERFVWHKLYASASRVGFAEKSVKDTLQAATLAAVLVEQDDAEIAASLREVPSAMVSAIKSRLPALRRLLVDHPQTLAQFELALGADQSL